jgi:hypothetical protein
MSGLVEKLSDRFQPFTSSLIMRNPTRLLVAACLMSCFFDADSVMGQWIDMTSLPADVLNCDECRRRLGLPPLGTAAAPQAHGSDTTILPTTRTDFREIILSSRELPRGDSSNANSANIPSASQASATQPATASRSDRISTSLELIPLKSLDKNPTSIATETETILPAPAATIESTLKTNEMSLAELGTTAAPSVVSNIELKPSVSEESKPRTTLSSPKVLEEKGSNEVLSKQESFDEKGKSLVVEPSSPLPLPENRARGEEIEKASILANRKPPALTGTVDADQPKVVAKNESVEPKSSGEIIAVAVPTTELLKPRLSKSSSDGQQEISESAVAETPTISGLPKTTTTIPSITSAVASNPMMVDGILTSPAAQKIEIELLKKQLEERDRLLSDLSKMQNLVDERMDGMVRTNNELLKKDEERSKELERLQRAGDLAVQERELAIANLRAELSSARADSKSQLATLAKRLLEVQQSKSEEVLKLSEQLLAAKKAPDTSTATGSSTAKDVALSEAESVVQQQKQTIEEMQNALTRLGNELERLESSEPSTNSKIVPASANEPTRSNKSPFNSSKTTRPLSKARPLSIDSKKPSGNAASESPSNRQPDVGSSNRRSF